MFNSHSTVIAHLSSFLLIFFRVSTFFMVMPFFRDTAVPPQVRILFSLLISFIVLLLLPTTPDLEILSLTGLLLSLKQILVGLVAGFIFQIVFEVFNAAGSLTALQTGLGFASLIDPQSHNQTAVVSQIYSYAALLVFLSLNGHLALIKLLIDSFNTVPITDISLPTAHLKAIIDFSSAIFSDSIFIALPAAIALLIVSLTFAIMSSVAPQLNIISVGFPITLIFGMTIIYLGLSNVILHMPIVFQQGFFLINKFYQGT